MIARVFVAGLMGIGCYDMASVELYGSLEAPFSISYNGETCAAAGVVEVRAVLDNGEYEAVVDCEVGRIVFEDVVAGPYTLTLYGMNEEGTPIVDSLANGPLEVEVLADELVQTREPLLLTEAAVKLRLRWDLGYGSCKSRNFKDFDIEVFDSASEKAVMRSDIACNTAGIGEEEYRIVPDRKRKLVGPIFDSIVVKPVAKNGGALGESFTVSYEEIEFPGPGDTVSLSIKCSQNACWVPGGC